MQLFAIPMPSLNAADRFAAIGPRMNIEHLQAVSYGYKATTATDAYIIAGDETKSYRLAR